MFELDVEKYSLDALKTTLKKILSLDNARDVVARLPDQGRSLRVIKRSIEKEIKLRQALNKTHKKVKKMEVKCASDTDVGANFEARLSSLDRRPVQFVRPHLPVRETVSHTASTSNVTHEWQLVTPSKSGVPSKAERMRIKLRRVGQKDKKANEDASSSSSSSTLDETQIDASDDLEFFREIHDMFSLEGAMKGYIFGHLTQTEQFDDQPGPSGMQKVHEGNRKQKELSDTLTDTSESTELLDDEDFVEGVIESDSDED